MRPSSARICSAFKRTFVLIVSILVLSGSATVARAGFLEELFGGGDQAPQAAPSRAAKRHYAEPRREKVAKVHSDVSFMPSPVARVRERQAYRPEHRPERRQVTTVAKADDGGASAGSKPVIAALCATEANVEGAPPTLLLAYDKTLRNGDIMVTDAGLQVFRGHAACPHDARDFIALSSAYMPKTKRSMLIAIEEAMKRPTGYVMTAKVEKR